MMAMTAAGCATVNVGSYVERGLDFRQYRTYAWGPADALPTGDPRLDRNPFFNDDLQGQIDQGLAARGLVLMPAATPDLQIHYHANVSERLQASHLDQSGGTCSSESCPGGVTEYEAGTIVLDVMDVKTGRLLWRGWAQTDLENLLDDEAKMSRTIQDAVKRMLRELPPTL
jgi:hypothetical protein